MDVSTALGILVVLGLAYAAFRVIKGRANRKPGSGKGGSGGKGDGTEHF